MSDTRMLVVTTLIGGRTEIQVPSAFITESGAAPSRQLVSFLQESNITIPESGMLTETNDSLVLHEVPKFG
jgi:hypothetical protein